jgi:membrane fusion protein (multidrug efflux system)
VDTSRIKVIVHVGERDILCVRTGAAVPFFVASEAGCGRTGTVRFASQEADAASNTYTVELAAENADGRLRPGMIADVALDGGEVPHAVIVPLAAIVPRKGQQVIYVAEAGRAVPRAVQIESIRGADAVVREGLSPGDRLVVEGQRGLQDGMLLTETAPAAAAP